MLTIQQIFDLGLKVGIQADPRGAKGVKEYLDAVKKQYDEASVKDKKFFDKEKLTNPYADCRIHVGKGDTKVKRIMAGIDIDGSELLLASQLEERGRKVDLVIAHHPLGKALAELHVVMDILIGIFEKAGVPVHVAEKIMEERIGEVGRGVHPSNHFRILDLARELGVNLMNTHTITDNLVAVYLDEMIKKRKPKFVGDIMDMLMEIPEYQEGTLRGAGPMLFSGNARHRVGKYLVEMTGGTNPSDKIYKELSRYGISTIVGMHMKDTSRDKASEFMMNVIIAGHMTSDSLGMNLFMDELEKKGIDIVACGGFIRVSRVAKKK